MMRTTFKALPIVAAIAASFAAGSVLAEDLIVKIGHVGPITGAIAHLGKDNENGARLAIDDLNAANVMIGGKKAKFELLAEDDGADPKQGTTVAQKLMDAKVNGVIGHLNSGTTIPASKIYSDNGIPQISPSATNPKYTQQGFKTAFRVVANDGQLGGTLGKYAINTLKGKNFAVIDDRTAYGQGVAEEFSKSVKANGGTIVSQQYTNDKATDFKALLTSIKAKKPDVIFVGGMDAIAGPMLKQMKELQIDAKLMGGDGICSEGLGALAGDAIGENKVYCAEAGGVTKAEEGKMEAWKKRYKDKFGIDVQVYAPYVYDATMVLVDSMKRAGSSDPAKYLPFIGKTSYNGVTGKIEFDAKGDMKNGTLTLYTYKGGKREKLEVVK